MRMIKNWLAGIVVQILWRSAARERRKAMKEAKERGQ